MSRARPRRGRCRPPYARIKADTKTHHRTGYHKPIKNPTTNYAPYTHKAFCKRCFGQYNKGICPMTGKAFKAPGCAV